MQGMTLRNYGVHVEMPDITYRGRGTTAGSANSLTHEIDFNPIFLRNNTHEFLRTTVGHEFAHLAVLPIYKTAKYPHGSEWQHIMTTYGLPVRVTHDYDITQVAPTRYLWKCDCKIHNLSAYHHHALVRTVKYSCDECANTIHTFVGAERRALGLHRTDRRSVPRIR